MSVRPLLFAFCSLACFACNGGTVTEESADAQVIALTEGEPWFEDVTQSAGIAFDHTYGDKRRFWFPEIMGGGIGFGDVDGDGFLDLYLVQSGDLEAGPRASAGNVLYRNAGDATFTDITQSSRTGDPGYGMGCVFGDVDDDGQLDLYVTNVGANVLYHNRGKAAFDDATAASGVGDEGWGTSCAFLDYDVDGDLDLVVINYLNWASEREIPCSSAYGSKDYCNPNNYNAPAADKLFRNEGGLRFRDVSQAAGLGRVFGNGLGVAPGDYNEDGRPDIYVANDLKANQLWIGQADGSFAEEALLAGCAVDQNGEVEAGMGVLAMDVENDGDLDLFMTHLREESNTFYLKEGPVFVDHTAMMGLSTPSYAFTGFGVGASDFDHDGRLDIYVANGRVTFGRPLFRADAPFAEPNQLFRGLPDLQFEEVSPRGGLKGEHYGNSRGLALGDYDNDGDIDVALLDNGGTAKLLKNIRADGSNWVQVRAVTESGRDALGARVGLTGDGAQWRQVQTAYSYCSSNDPRAHFGLPPGTAQVEVEIRWPGGQVERFGPLDVKQHHSLVQGSGR